MLFLYSKVGIRVWLEEASPFIYYNLFLHAGPVVKLPSGFVRFSHPYIEFAYDACSDSLGNHNPFFVEHDYVCASKQIFLASMQSDGLVA